MNIQSFMTQKKLIVEISWFNIKVFDLDSVLILQFLKFDIAYSSITIYYKLLN